MTDDGYPRVLAGSLMGALRDDLNPPGATTLTYTLSVTNAAGAVTNASISSQGIVTWTPTAGQAPSVNTFTTRVTDGAAWATNRFNVTVTAGP